MEVKTSESLDEIVTVLEQAQYYMDEVLATLPSGATAEMLEYHLLRVSKAIDALRYEAQFLSREGE